MSNDPIPPADIQAQLERIVSSPGFAAAGRGTRFLRYVVEQTLAGNGEALKEFSLGVEVFDRGETYDPRIDSSVRVEAGRLRTKLDEYYNGEGKLDEIRISLPRGGYVPQFARLQVERPPQNAGPPVRGATAMRKWPLAVGVAVPVILIMIWLAGGRQPGDAAVPGGMTIAVLAFEEYSSSADDANLAAELTTGVTAELARLGTIGVASHTSAMQFAGPRKPLKEIAQTLHADVVLEAAVTNTAEGIRVTARMVDARVDRKVWVDDFPGTRADLRDLERRIAVAASAAALARRPAQ